MCNRARNKAALEPERLKTNFATMFDPPRQTDNRFKPDELVPRSRAYVVTQGAEGRALDVMSWDVLGGMADYPMTNVRQLGLPQWKRLASDPARRCLIPVTEFCEWAPTATDLGDGKKPVKGEMWFALLDQPVFAIAGFWQETAKGKGFTMVTCDPNELVAPIHPKAMVTILDPDQYDAWLTAPYEEAITMQRPYPAEKMTVRGPVFPTREKAQPTLL